MKNKITLALLPGDGIGPEVVQEAVKVLRVLEKNLGIKLTLNEVPVEVVPPWRGHPLHGWIAGGGRDWMGRSFRTLLQTWVSRYLRTSAHIAPLSSVL